MLKVRLASKSLLDVSTLATPSIQRTLLPSKLLLDRGLAWSTWSTMTTTTIVSDLSASEVDCIVECFNDSLIVAEKEVYEDPAHVYQMYAGVL